MQRATFPQAKENLIAWFNMGIRGAAAAASIQLMPVLLGGVTGVWLATPAAALLMKYRKRYGY